MPLAVVPIGIPRFPPLLPSLVLALRSWRLLLPLLCSRLLLPLFPDCRASLPGRSMDRGRPLYVFAPPMLRLGECSARSALLARS